MSPKPASNILIGLAFVLILWIGSYLALSRRGYAESAQWDPVGFYYFTPEDTHMWRRSEAICACVFWPLNFVDRTIGSGRGHSAEPLWNVEL